MKLASGVDEVTDRFEIRAKPAVEQNQQQGKWVRTVAQPLTGKTLGILGLGVIGQRVANIAAVLGMRVIGTKRRPEAMANVAAVLPPDRTAEVLAQSDFGIGERPMLAVRLRKIISVACICAGSAWRRTTAKPCAGIHGRPGKVICRRRITSAS